MKNSPKLLLLATIIVVGQFLSFLLSHFFGQLEILGGASLILSFITPFLVSLIYAAIFQNINKRGMWDYFALQAISYPCVLAVYFSFPDKQVERMDVAVISMLLYGAIQILPILPVCAIYTEKQRAIGRKSVQLVSILAALILIPVLAYLLLFFIFATADGMRMNGPMPERIESQADLWQGEIQQGISKELASILAILYGIEPQDVSLEHLTQITNITVYPDKVMFSQGTILGEQWADAVMNQLHSFSSLSVLGIEDYANINYEGLIGLDKLATISLTGKNIEEIHFTTSESVTSLTASNTSISDFENLSAFPNLFYIQITDSPASYFPDLSGFEQLSSITIRDCLLEKLPTGYPSGIRYVEIVGNNIKSLEGIENLINNTSINELNLRTNQIEDISDFSKCHQPQGNYLSQLLLSDNRISDINSLQNIIVDSLWLEGNQISDLTGLSERSGITYLEVGQNKISDVSPLRNLESLENLRADDNNISDVASLGSLPNLDTLSLSGNQIENAEQFANLEHLQILVLENNRLTDAAPFAKLKELHRLVLTGNPINNINKLKNKRGLEIDFE